MIKRKVKLYHKHSFYIDLLILFIYGKNEYNMQKKHTDNVISYRQHLSLRKSNVNFLQTFMSLMMFLKKSYV